MNIRFGAFAYFCSIFILLLFDVEMTDAGLGGGNMASETSRHHKKPAKSLASSKHKKATTAFAERKKSKKTRRFFRRGWLFYAQSIWLKQFIATHF